MDDINPDQIASELFELADSDSRQPPGVLTLARRLMGEGCVQFVRCLDGKPSLFDLAQNRIFVRAKLQWPERNFCIAHEISEWNFERVGFFEHTREQLCNQVAARLIAPRESFPIIDPNYRSVRGLADWFRTTETVAALRWAEVTGRPTVVVDPNWIAVRGTLWAWPAEPLLRLIARGQRNVPEIERIELSDDQHRILLRAA